MRIVINEDNPNSCYRCDFRSGTGKSDICTIINLDVTTLKEGVHQNCPIRPADDPVEDKAEAYDILMGEEESE